MEEAAAGTEVALEEVAGEAAAPSSAEATSAGGNPKEAVVAAAVINDLIMTIEFLGTNLG